jgi:Icc-related predicted phosphoesterase
VKIFATSDLHGNHAIIDKLRDVEDDCDLILICGDIHEDNSTHEIGETRMFNCACDYFKNILKGWMVDLETQYYESVSI